MLLLEYNGEPLAVSRLLEPSNSWDAAPAGHTPAHLAARGGHAHGLFMFLQTGSDVNSQDHVGETVMHKAVRSGSAACVGLLLSCGAHLHMRNHAGQTPLELAQACGNLQLIAILSCAAQTSCSRATASTGQALSLLKRGHGSAHTQGTRLKQSRF
ncbi:ankyrin repeat domain-containing protein 37 [Lampetra fluviatilis]